MNHPTLVIIDLKQEKLKIVLRVDEQPGRKKENMPYCSLNQAHFVKTGN
jgi:hypothetical protein